MQIFEITSRLSEKILKGMNTVVAPTVAPTSSPPGWDYAGAVKAAGPAAQPQPAALPTPTVNPLPSTPGYSTTTGNAPGWDYAGATKAAAPAPAAAPTPAPAAAPAEQPSMSLGDRAKVAGGRLARGAQRGATIAGAIGNALGSQILTKAGLPSSLGMGSSNNPFGKKEEQARKAVAATNKTLADQLYKNWAAAASKTAPGSPEMQKSLDSVIKNTLMRGRNLTSIGQYISPDKANDVNQQLQTINQSRQSLSAKNAQMTYQDWANLVNATSELNHLLAFWPAKYNGIEMKADGSFWQNGRRLVPTNPQDMQIIQTAMQTPGDIRMPANANISAVNNKIKAAAQGQTK